MAQEVTRIKKRIKSVTGSYKITSAMKLVSTVKLKKWKNKMLATKDYALRIDEIARKVFSSVEESNNPYYIIILTQLNKFDYKEDFINKSAKILNEINKLESN